MSPIEHLQTEPLDHVIVDVNEAGAVTYWTQILDVGEEDLRRAVAEVGPVAHDIRELLGK